MPQFVAPGNDQSDLQLGQSRGGGDGVMLFTARSAEPVSLVCLFLSLSDLRRSARTLGQLPERRQRLGLRDESRKRQLGHVRLFACADASLRCLPLRTTVQIESFTVDWFVCCCSF